jgi:hypothetical protein
MARTACSERASIGMFQMGTEAGLQGSEVQDKVGGRRLIIESRRWL